jgi:hypothetical protein
MPRKKYERKNLTDKEIEEGMEKWLAIGRTPRGVRAHVWKWLKDDPNGLARSIENYDRLRDRERDLLIEKMLWEHRLFAIRDILSVAQLTLPSFKNRFGPKIWTAPQLLTCFALRLSLDFSPRRFALHVHRQFPERLLIFGRLKHLPSAATLSRFETNLSDETVQLFLDHLRPLNPVVAETVESHRKSE